MNPRTLQKLLKKGGLFFFLLVITGHSFGQSEPNNPITYDTTITESANGEGPLTWQVRITRQANGDNTPRPAIFSMPGSGETGTSLSNLTLYGPHYWLANGWDGGVQLSNGKHYPILVTIEQPGQNTRPWHLKAVMQILLNVLPVKRNSVHVAGLSQGSYEWGELIAYAASAGDQSAMSMIKSWVDLEGVGPGDNFSGFNQAYPTVYGTWAQQYGGRFFGLEGSQDSRNIWQITQAMNAVVPNCAYFSYQNIGGGAHCCWNSMYDPSVTNWSCVAPVTNLNIVPSTNPANTMGDYKVNPTTGTNIFQWELRQGDTSMVGTATPPSTVPPTVSAGSALSITLPVSTVTLTGKATGNGGATISTTVWTMNTGPNKPVIVSAGSLTTAVTGLVQGSYTFKLTATDNNGNSGSGQVTVTVGAAKQTQQVPTVNAGAAQTITLPTSTVNLSATATAYNGANLVSGLWSMVSGPNTPVFSTPTNSYTTAVSGLIAGTYVFQLLARDNNGLTGTGQVSVTAKPASPTTQAPTVNAGSAQTITLPTSTVSLKEVSTAYGGAKLVSILWSQVSGPNTASITAPKGTPTTVTSLVAGTYVFKLTATDNNGKTGSGQVTIAVNAAASSGSTGTVTPVAPTSLKTLIAPGEYQAFFLNESTKKLYAMGTNLRTQGVNGAGVPGTTLAVNMPSNLTVQTAAAGLHGGAAVDNNGNVWCWGDNSQGTTGNGTVTATETLVPTQITTDATGAVFTGVTALSAFYSGNAGSGWYAVKSNGTLWVWGQTLGGMAGDGTAGQTTQTRPKQVPVPGGRQVAQVASGNQLIVLCTDGTVWTCGGSNPNPQDMGYAATATTELSLVQLAGLSNIVQVAGGGSFNYALNSSGVLFGWGYYGFYMGGPTGQFFQLATPTNLTTALNLPHPVKQIAVSMTTSYAILTDGTLWAWGDNAQGGIGNGKELNFATTSTPYEWDWNVGDLLQQAPVQVGTRTDWAGVFATQPYVMYVYAETTSGQIYSWGRNKGGVIGNGVVGCSSDVVADYPNSWDVTVPTAVNPLGVTSVTVVASPYCVKNPNGSPCNECTIAAAANAAVTSASAAALTNNATPEQFLVYPTLTTGTLNLRIVSDTNGTVQVAIFDMNGRMVQQDQLSKENTWLEKSYNVGRLSSGMYIMQVLIGDRKRMVTKFVKQ